MNALVGKDNTGIEKIMGKPEEGILNDNGNDL
jgi:hypothetical protein